MFKPGLEVHSCHGPGVRCRSPRFWLDQQGGSLPFLTATKATQTGNTRDTFKRHYTVDTQRMRY